MDIGETHIIKYAIYLHGHISVIYIGQFMLSHMLIMNIFLTRSFSLRYVNSFMNLLNIITLLSLQAAHADCEVKLCILCWLWICVNCQAEVNAQKASNNAQRSARQLEETITDFQRQKLGDVKVSHTHTHTHSPALKHQCWTDSNHCFVLWQMIFTDFITVEMLFHAKALEVYTHTYQNLEAMCTQRDLEVVYANEPKYNSSHLKQQCVIINLILRTMFLKQFYRIQIVLPLEVLYIWTFESC